MPVNLVLGGPGPESVGPDRHFPAPSIAEPVVMVLDAGVPRLPDMAAAVFAEGSTSAPIALVELATPLSGLRYEPMDTARDRGKSAGIESFDPESEGVEGSFPKPRYPASAVRRGQSGTVTLLLRVEPWGSVGGVEVRRSSGHAMLDEAARRTVEQRWRFMAGSRRVYTVDIIFRLGGGDAGLDLE